MSVTSFTAPSQVDYGYRVGADSRVGSLRWTVMVNDEHALAFGTLASGEAATADEALRLAELAVRGLPDSGRRWPDGYEPHPSLYPQRT